MVTRPFGALWCLLVCSAAYSVTAEEPGHLHTQDGIRVLELSGTNEQRGAAQGRLLGDDIARVLNLLIEHGPGGKTGYEQVLLPLTAKMNLHAHHLAELHGILAGMKEKTGEPPVVPVLGRTLGFDDLLALNCIPDTARVACSTFMAWGAMTADHQTVGGRNLDWLSIPGLADQQLVVVHRPDRDSNRSSWISVTVPGFSGCLTGMNEHGVVLAMHDVVTGKPWIDSGFSPRGFALRDALESARPYTETRDIKAILLARPSAVGNLVPVFYPVRKRSAGTPGVIIEYDGHSGFSDRVTLGVIKGHSFGIGTNHYRIKSENPPSCDRFNSLFAELSRMESAGEKLSVDKAFSLLESVAEPRGEGAGLLTYHSVVFEPAAMRMHVALAGGNKPAAQGKKVSFDAGALLKAGRASE